MPPSALLGLAVPSGAPPWRQVDSDLAIALTEIEADECPGCGHPRDESMDPANEFAYLAEPVRCHACAARDRAAKRDSGDDWDDSGIAWTTTREEVTDRHG